jgi:hypothetical protein
MAHYYVNQHAQANGDHEVHKSGCSHMPKDKPAVRRLQLHASTTAK